MSGIHDQNRIESLRRRLYERGTGPKARKQSKLSDTPTEVNKTWQQPPKVDSISIDDSRQSPTKTVPVANPAINELDEYPEESTETMSNNKRPYRMKLLFVGLGFFILAVVVSSVLIIMQPSSISGDNIVLSLQGPFTIGGGEVLPLQVGITNNNTVAIQSANLVIQYPLGTKSATDDNKELYIERFPLETIQPGQTLNIPLRALVFGEENQEKTITATIEYRVEGSNALFFKEAEPLRFKISSSPIVLKVAALKKISSGQETDIELTITSNSPNQISNILVSAEYPDGFDFTSSAPSPVKGDNVWEIGTIGPEEHKTITIRGLIIGKETDEKVAHFSVGVPSERDPYTMASVFTTAATEFEIEQPFIDVSLQINSGTNDAVVEPGQRAGVVINFENTLEDTLYDAVIEVRLNGNALSDLNVGPPNGFYDSSSKTIIWDPSNYSPLKEMVPGKKERLTFTITPAETDRTPQINLSVSVKARRVSERDVPEQIVGVADGVVKVASAPQLLGAVTYLAADSGPVPPEVGKETTYTLNLGIGNGSNEIVNTVVTATLPNYVKWLNDVSGAVTYNPTSREVTWSAGAVNANSNQSATFRVSITPSTSQIGTSPTLMGEQRLRGEDNFTGSFIRTTNAAVTTQLSSEAGFGRESGRVKAQE